MTPLSAPDDAGRPTSPWEKAALAAEILLSYRRVRRLMRAHTLATAVERLPAGPQRRPPSSRDRVIALRLARAVSRVLRIPGTDSRCLMQSLVVIALLARRGIESSLAIGARSERGFAAHAWVEHEGAPLLPDSGYPVLVRLTAESRGEPIGAGSARTAEAFYARAPVDR